MSNNLTVSEAQNIQSPPGNSLAVFLDKNGNLQLKDVRGNVHSLSNYLPSGAGTPTLPDVFLGAITDTTSLNQILNNYNLNVIEGIIPVLFTTGAPSKGSQATSKRYLWKLGAGKFFPIGGSDIESKLELIQEYFLSNNDVEIILSQENAQEVPLGTINEDFISYMNSNGPYVFNNVNKTYVVTFTQDDIDYAYIFQGTLGTYGFGNLQFQQDDFIFIYQSTNAGEPTNSTYIRITRAEAVVLQTTASFVSGAIYVITDADVNLYGGTEITLTAITSNQLSLQGSGLFYCPKYDLTIENSGYGIWTRYMEGTFYNISGTFTSGETVTSQNGATAIYLAENFLYYISGDWSGATEIGGVSGTCEVSGFESPIYSIGQIVHWGGKSWLNLAGGVGQSVDKYTLNSDDWSEIPFNSTDYNIYVDEIQYDFGNDMIIYRKDRYNNIVSGSNQVFVEYQDPGGDNYGNPIKDFQWGCASDDFNKEDYLIIGIQGNEVVNSYFETLNSQANLIWFNNLKSDSAILKNIFSKTTSLSYNNLEKSTIFANKITSGCIIVSNNLNDTSEISNNTLAVDSSISSNIINEGRITVNEVNSFSQINSNILFNSNIESNLLSNTSSITKNNINYSSINNCIINSSTVLSNYLFADSSITGCSIDSDVNISNNSLYNSIFFFSNTNSTLSSINANRFNENGVEINIGSATNIYGNYSKNLLSNSNGVSKIQYINDSDVIVITDVDA